MITPQPEPYPHTGSGVEVHRIFHKLRLLTIENFNSQFKGIFVLGQVSTKGWINTRRFTLGAILVYQLVLPYRFQHNMHLRVSLKAFLKAA